LQVYGVHRQEWESVSETELLTTNKTNAEQHAKAVSVEYTYGLVVITRRELDRAGSVWVVSVWRRGQKVTDHGSDGLWRKAKEMPI